MRDIPQQSTDGDTGLNSAHCRPISAVGFTILAPSLSLQIVQCLGHFRSSWWQTWAN